MPDSLMLPELDAMVRVGVALLIGLAVGLERQWSGHASGPDARFAGLRTFALLGALGAAAGLFVTQGQSLPGAIMLGAGGAMIVVAYAAALRRQPADLDATTEVAALVVLALGALAGTGWLMLASSVAAVAVLALSEKQRLHRLVSAIEQRELQAALQFTVLAVVVLPLLPAGPYFGVLAIRPRALWTVVLAFCALNFASYVARRLVGSSRGYGIAGALGGLMSSTAVTLTYARRSRLQGENANALARGVVAACTVLIPRILVISAVLNPRVAWAAVPYLAPALIAGIGFVFFARDSARTEAEPPPDRRSPLRFGIALQLAVAFQLSMSVIALLHRSLGEAGVYGAAIALGLTDMDALTASMSSRSSGIDPAIAGRALAVGMLSNTAFKLSISLVMGTPAFRRRASLGLATLAALTIIALEVL